MADISVRDLVQMYKDSIVLYKGSPVLVLNISELRRFTIWDLEKQIIKVVLFKQENFAPPKMRLGYINLGTNCVYVQRKPLRRYKIGLTTETVERINTDHPLNRYEEDEAARAIYHLKAFNLYETLKGIYPPLGVAIGIAIENKGVAAFDRQFAVGHDKCIYYKGKHVGFVDRSQNITFFEGKEHLEKALLISR